MEGIGGYILSIAAVSICCGIVRRLTDGKAGISGVVQSLCGIILAITVISPVVKLKVSDVNAYADQVQIDAEKIVQESVDLSKQELRTIITQRTTAYILEKASLYECSIHHVEVELSSDSIPAPCAVSIRGTFTPYIRNQLSGTIDSNLGIPKEKQQWIYQN